MRPHVELVDERDLIWHMAEFLHAEGKASQRNLCYDEEDGSVSARLRFDSDWGRPGGVHHAETEWYIISGEVTVGDRKLGPGDYWHAATGVYTPPLKVKEGTEVLFYREYGDWGFDVVDKDRDFVREDQKLIVLNSGSQEWVPVEIGSPMRFDLGGTPVPGLYIKMLHRDVTTGFYSRLIKAKPGWIEHPLAHHPVFEESYCLDGGLDYNYGSFQSGVYQFRPALVRHGDFASDPEFGCTWLIRCDGDLVDWYTNNARLEMHGDPVNWGPDLPHTQAPLIAQPVRSRSIGDMKDRSYQ
jgi:Domain of unknown function (DUF4437)